MRNTLDRVGNWIEAAPGWLRPPLVGALIVVALTASRGGLFVIPIVVVFLLLTSPTPLVHLGLILLMFGLAILGGALAGFSYSFSARWLKQIPLIGPYVAGMVTFFPYGVMAVGIVRLLNGEPVLGPPDGASVFTLIILTLVFGPILHPLFRDR